MMISLKALSLVFACILLLSLGVSLAQANRQESAGNESWATARRDSSGQAPDPLRNAASAIIQVYVAPTYGWRGVVAVHPWIIYKREGETHYQRVEVIGWGSGDKVRFNRNIPDGYWFGARPRVLLERRGPLAAAMIPKIEAAIASYPWPQTYHAWPGPNSNTFLAHIGREVPELKLNMPANAIGKDYRSLRNPIGLPPSGRGLQLSLLGVAGLTVGAEEGVEINVLGLNLGLGISPFQLRLPFIGGLGDNNLQKEDPQT